MIDNTTIITIVILLVLGFSLLLNRQGIARHLGKNSMLPFRAIFGERPWVMREEQRAERFAKVVLPFIATLCFLMALLVFAAIIW